MLPLCQRSLSLGILKYPSYLYHSRPIKGIWKDCCWEVESVFGRYQSASSFSVFVSAGPAWEHVMLCSHCLTNYKSQVVSRSRTCASSYGDLTIGGAELEEVKSLLILGVTLNFKLTFESHLREVVSTATRSLGVVRRAGQLYYRLRVLKLLCRIEIFAAYLMFRNFGFNCCNKGQSKEYCFQYLDTTHTHAHPLWEVEQYSEFLAFVD